MGLRREWGDKVEKGNAAVDTVGQTTVCGTALILALLGQDIVKETLIIPENVTFAHLLSGYALLKGLASMVQGVATIRDTYNRNVRKRRRDHLTVITQPAGAYQSVPASVAPAQPVLAAQPVPAQRQSSDPAAPVEVHLERPTISLNPDYFGKPPPSPPLRIDVNEPLRPSALPLERPSPLSQDGHPVEMYLRGFIQLIVGGFTGVEGVLELAGLNPIGFDLGLIGSLASTALVELGCACRDYQLLQKSTDPDKKRKLRLAGYAIYAKGFEAVGWSMLWYMTLINSFSPLGWICLGAAAYCHWARNIPRLRSRPQVGASVMPVQPIAAPAAALEVPHTPPGEFAELSPGPSPGSGDKLFSQHNREAISAAEDEQRKRARRASDVMGLLEAAAGQGSARTPAGGAAVQNPGLPLHPGMAFAAAINPAMAGPMLLVGAQRPGGGTGSRSRLRSLSVPESGQPQNYSPQHSPLMMPADTVVGAVIPDAWPEAAGGPLAGTARAVGRPVAHTALSPQSQPQPGTGSRGPAKQPSA